MNLESRLYRRDVTRRQTPQDRPNAGGSATLSGLLANCGPCEDCLTRGAIDECSQCASRGAPTSWQFSFPTEASLMSGGTGPGSDRIVQHAADCTWESDDVGVACDYQTDEFGWTLNLADIRVWRTELTFARRAGGGCADVRWTYRNWGPFQCLCPNTMVLDRQSVQGIDPDRLPCSFCLRPVTITCGGVSGLPEVYVVEFAGGSTAQFDTLGVTFPFDLTWPTNQFCPFALGVTTWGKFLGKVPGQFESNNFAYFQLVCDPEGGAAWQARIDVEFTSFFGGTSCGAAGIWTPPAEFDPKVGGIFSNTVAPLSQLHIHP